MNDLLTMILNTVEDIENNPEEVLDKLLSVEFYMTSYNNKEYLGSFLCMALGGPNIYIDTRTSIVTGYWGNEKIERDYDSTEFNNLIKEYFYREEQC